MRADGFTLLEAVIATAILATGLASLAQIAALSTRATNAAAARSVATLLAIDKLEQLRALQWTVDRAGMPASDAGLATSPGDALDRDADGFVDHPPGATRRWSIQPLPPYAADALVLQVRVIAGGQDVRLVTVRARRAN
ncbi:MAG TPA: prepilin-type N-terminal cleavage/methylation domain-containing protein [Vicinamibacterales bacterium]|nr:prepilin-type N-terminal cleavage/methylation domain-containing protein [Vicinamibacterales bacterium]